MGLSGVTGAPTDGHARLLDARRLVARLEADQARCSASSISEPLRSRGAGIPVDDALSDRTLAALEGYIRQLGIERTARHAFSATAAVRPISSDAIGDDFRDVRISEFGANERRTCRERSRPLPAAPGPTYVPVTLTTIRSLMRAATRPKSYARERMRVKSRNPT